MSSLQRFYPSSGVLASQPLRVCVEEAARHGFGGVEVSHPHLHQTQEKPVAVRQRAHELGLRLTLHATFTDLNPLSANAEIRAVSRSQVLESLGCAAELAADMVVVHPGQVSGGGDTERHWHELFDFCAELSGHAERLGIGVAIEGMERKLYQFLVEPTALNRLAEAMAAEGWSRLGLTVDLAHLATFTDPVPAYREVTRIRHTHLSDGNPPHATHLPLGHGRLPLAEMVAAALEVEGAAIVLEGLGRVEGGGALAHAATILHALQAQAGER